MEELEIILEQEGSEEAEVMLATEDGSIGWSGVKDVQVDGKSVVDEQGIASIDLSKVAELDNVLRDILVAIQNGGTTSTTIAEMEQLIVSYLETKTIEEVEN